jgi:hypothetical protein
LIEKLESVVIDEYPYLGDKKREESNRNKTNLGTHNVFIYIPLENKWCLAGMCCKKGFKLNEVDPDLLEVREGDIVNI